MRFDKLLELIGHFDEEDGELFETVISDFFHDMLPPDFLDSIEHRSEEMTFRSALGEAIFHPLFMSAVEFFISNEYPKGASSWDAIDFLLNKSGILMAAEDRIYLKGLRNSYMSIYEVIDVKLDKSLTLKNFLEEDMPLITVKEKRATHFLCPWDLVGARVVETLPEPLVAGGLLLLNRDVAKEAKKVIREISKKMMSGKYFPLLEKSTKDPVLLVKKMWAKEIAESWLMQEISPVDGQVN